jgi:hypothetical protein
MQYINLVHYPLLYVKCTDKTENNLLTISLFSTGFVKQKRRKKMPFFIFLYGDVANYLVK